MSYQSILAIAVLASTAIAAPFNLTSRGNGGCADADSAGNPFAALVSFYTDKDCSDKEGAVCIYAYQGTVDGGSGYYSCGPGDVPSTTPYYAKLEDTNFSDVQVVFTADQTCPPDGPGAVFAVLSDTGACVRMNRGGSNPGVTTYPHGGSGLQKRDTPDTFEYARNVSALAKSVVKRNPKCSGFSIDSQQQSESQSVKISQIVDCTNGNDQGCSITTGEEHSESVATSYSFSAGGGVEGVFSVEATFGQEFTSTETTSIQTGFSIDAGQKGYLSAYCSATLFKGHFTGCDSGASEQAGESLVLKKDGMEYEVIYTGSARIGATQA